MALKISPMTGIVFQKVEPVYDETGGRKLVPTGDDPVVIPCDDVLCAIGQENHFPGADADFQGHIGHPHIRRDADGRTDRG